jgi:2-desacetyl-2-hydroxyethyl bacteriochlorophyllide A dehydrogenase
MKANAVVFTSRNTVSFQQVDCPDPGADDIVVDVTHSWISNGTEGSFLRGERTAGDTPWEPGDPDPFPIVAGYQKVGQVTWVGSEVSDFAVGETVFATVGAVDGMFSPRGGQVSPSISKSGGIWKLPDGHDPVKFSGLVLTQVGYNCGTRPPIDPGAPAIVIGDGLVGQWAAQTLAWRGADVMLVGRHEDRLNRFTQGECVNGKLTNWIATALARYGKSVQVVVDTVGSVNAVESSYALMAKYGHSVSAGFYGMEDQLRLQPPRHGELSIDLVSGWAEDRMDKTLELIADDVLQTSELITHRFPVGEAAEAWALIESKREPVLGVILEWK